MKKKFFTVFLSLFLVFSNVVSSFANPLVAVPISYELLMGLMGIGVAFGLSLPTDNSSYWDYTNSLRKHLQVVDDEYLELLDKSAKEWKTNNNNKPDDDKDPLQIPLIPGSYETLKNLFNNVGNDLVTNSNKQYLGSSLKPIFVLSDSNKLDSTYSLSSYDVGVPYSIGFLNSNNEYITLKFINNGDLTYKVETIYNGDTSIYEGTFPYFVNDSSRVGFYVRGGSINSVMLGTLNPSTGYYGNISFSSIGSDNFRVDSSKYSSYSSYTYTPSNPSIEEDAIIVPGGLPNISIPGIETVPGYDPNIEIVPPFIVDDPIYNPGDNPGDNPSDNPNIGLFPSLGSVTDYITGLVVPSDSYWTDTWNDLYNNFTSSFPLVDMDNFNNLVTGEKKFPNIDINIMGVKGRVVNGDVINSIVDWLRPIIAGFMMLCLMLFNYRKIYKTIRGIEPFQGIAQGTSDFRTGISEYNYLGSGLSKADYEANEKELAKALYDHYQDTGKTYKVKI